MELLQLQYFRSAAELESMTAAAKKHGIPQSAMSITVAKLEKELGRPLFDRVGNRIRLNPDGQRFLQHLQNSLNALENGLSALRQETEVSGEIKILVLEKRRQITDCILAFHKQYPAVRFSICHNIYEQSYSDFDLCVSSFPQDNATYDSVPLCSERIMLAVYNTHKLAAQSQVRLGELAEESFIFLPEKNSIHRIMTAKCRQCGFTPRIAIICDDPYYVRKYISAGLGIAFTPADSWMGLYDHNITLLPINEPDALRNTSIYWHKTRHMPKAALLFKDFLISYLKNKKIEPVCP